MLAYSAGTWLVIEVLSAKDYEWMIGDVSGEQTSLTICTIPKSGDLATDVLALLTGAPVLLLLTAGLVSLHRHRRSNGALVLSASLAIFWAYRFFGRTLFC